MKKIVLSILTLMWAGLAVVTGQDVVFTGSAPTKVEVGRRFQISYMVNAEGKNFKAPSMEAFRVLAGPSTSQSSRVEIINGKVSQHVDYTFTFIVQATIEGDFEIEPASVEVDGKTYRSNPIKISVVSSSRQQGGSKGSGNSNSNQQNDSGVDPGDVFLRAVVNDRNPYQGEEIIVTYKLYYRINISNLAFDKEPSFKGFWVDDLLENKQNFRQYQETYNGKVYQVAEIRKYALFPQRSGKLEIAPVLLTCQAQIKSQPRRSSDPFDAFFNDPFFNRFRTVEVPLESNSLTVNVKPLPSEGKSAAFKGAVGQFSISSDIDRTELKTNEALNLKIVISGKGNIELIDEPPVRFPPDFEVYDPKVTKKINDTPSGVSGVKSFEYLIIPRAAGDFTIDPVPFTWFDPEKRKYVSAGTPQYKIHVEKGTGDEQTVAVGGNINRSDIRFIGSDIRFIKTGNPHLKASGDYFFASTLWYLLLLLPLVLFIVIVIIRKKELQRRSNVALMRNRKATKIARKRLKKAEQLMKEKQADAFFEEVSDAIWGYLSDKFTIPLASLSMETVEEKLKSRDLAPETIKKITDLLNRCEFARFAPSGKSESMESLFGDAASLIMQIEKEVKS
ncbi:MAG: BatD family protein [Bacteroidales bacterium]